MSDWVYVAIDVETTGADLTRNQVVAIGAAGVSRNGLEVLVPPVRWVLDTSSAEWEPRCKEEFWDVHPDVYRTLVTDLLPTEKLTPAQFAARFREWFVNLETTLTPRGIRIRVVTDFPSFDIAWLNVTLARGGAKPLYMLVGHWIDVRDTESFEEAVTGIDLKKLPSGQTTSHLPEVDALVIATRHATLNHQLFSAGSV